MDGKDLEWISPGSQPEGGPPSTGPGPGVAERKPRRGRTIRTVAIAAVTAGALALVGASVASAQSSGTTTTKPGASTSTTTASGTAPAPGTHRALGGFKGGPGFPAGFGALGAGGTIHGEFVRRNPSGGYQTIDTQLGTVQAVSTTSITVKSADGFTKTYTVTTNTVVNSGRDGIGSVKTTDTVQLEAVVTGSGASAVAEAKSIIDTTALGNIGGYWNPAPAKPPTPPTTG
jgi:hypothetical protein